MGRGWRLAGFPFLRIMDCKRCAQPRALCGREVVNAAVVRCDTIGSFRFRNLNCLNGKTLESQSPRNAHPPLEAQQPIPEGSGPSCTNPEQTPSAPEFSRIWEGRSPKLAAPRCSRRCPRKVVAPSTCDCFTGTFGGELGLRFFWGTFQARHVVRSLFSETNLEGVFMSISGKG